MDRLLRSMGFFAAVALAAPGCTSSTNSAPQPPPSSSWHVQAGGSDSTQAFQGLNFYPSSTLTIDAGDTVTWSFPAGEPHTVALLGAGQKLPSADDPANQNPAGGKTYDGTTFVNSGFKLLGGTYSLQFTKPGTYQVYCLIHQPEMVQTIVVQAAFTPYPHPQSYYDSAGATAFANDLAAASSSVSLFPYAALGLHLAAGISPGGVGAPSATSTVMRFLSTTDVTTQTATVPVGSTVTWTNLSNNSPHTVTFAPVGQAFPTLNPFAPASGGNVYDGTTLVNSGPLFPGQSVSFTFTKAGTYQYHCIFHDDTENMISTLVVQ
jgi:plastocyanin